MVPGSATTAHSALTASRSEVAANSNVTSKCTPHSHPAGSPAPPPPRDAQPRSPASSLGARSRLPRVRAAPRPKRPARGRGGPANIVLAVHKFKQGCLLGQNPEVLLYRKSQKKACINFSGRVWRHLILSDPGGQFFFEKEMKSP